MKFRSALIITILSISLPANAEEKAIDNGYLGFNSNPVKLTFDSGKKGETPAGTRVDILIWSLSYSKDYVKDVMSAATKDEMKTLKQSREASACLNNPACKAVISRYDTEGMVMKSYELNARYGNTVERGSLVKLLDGPFKGKQAWVDDKDLYLKR